MALPSLPFPNLYMTRTSMVQVLVCKAGGHVRLARPMPHVAVLRSVQHGGCGHAAFATQHTLFESIVVINMALSPNVELGQFFLWTCCYQGLIL